MYTRDIMASTDISTGPLAPASEFFEKKGFRASKYWFALVRMGKLVFYEH